MTLVFSWWKFVLARGAGVAPPSRLCLLLRCRSLGSAVLAKLLYSLFLTAQQITKT